MQHPDRETLLAYSRGQLPPAADEAMCEHIEVCSGECLAYLDSLPGSEQAAMDAVMRRAARWYA